MINIEQDWKIEYCTSEFASILGIKLNDNFWDRYKLPGVTSVSASDRFRQMTKGDRFSSMMVRREGRWKRDFYIEFLAILEIHKQTKDCTD